LTPTTLLREHHEVRLDTYDDAQNQAQRRTDYQHCPLLPLTPLAEAHLLWHQALTNYQEPDAFRANLNATIQSLRNVTFALQSEKHSVANFEEWYSKWQVRLASETEREVAYKCSKHSC